MAIEFIARSAGGLGQRSVEERQTLRREKVTATRISPAMTTLATVSTEPRSRQ